MKSALASFGTAILLSLVAGQSHAIDPSVLDRYKTYASQGRWSEALPLIEDIVKQSPSISTSWFNYGVCLDELGKHGKAANAFREAYRLRPSDYGAQYRAFRSLSLAKDFDGFTSFAEQESKGSPEILGEISGMAEFKQVVETPAFQRLLKRRAR